MKQKKRAYRDRAQCDIKDCPARYGESYARAVDLGWQVISFFGLPVLLCPNHRRGDVELPNLKASAKGLTLGSGSTK